MRKVLFASVAVLGLAATPLMAQTTLNSKDSAGGSVNTPAGGANVGGSGSGGDINRSSPSGTTSGTYNRDRDPSQAQAPSTRSRDHDVDRDKMNRSDDNSARPYAPGQQKKGY